MVEWDRPWHVVPICAEWLTKILVENAWEQWDEVADRGHLSNTLLVSGRQKAHRETEHALLKTH